MRAIRQPRGRCLWRCVLLAGVPVAGLAIGGCPDDGAVVSGPRFANSTDKSNAGAAYVGSAACRQCHAEQAAAHALHGHAAALQTVAGSAPRFETQAATGGVPNPPPGLSWGEISYVLGGFTGGVRFVDQNGFLIVDGVSGAPTEWRLPLPAGGAGAGFSGAADARRGLEFAEFAPRTTAPRAASDGDPSSLGTRPGILGTWHEDGAQCESCHGPGGNHFRATGEEVRIDRARIFVDPDGSESCAMCHRRPYDGTTREILAAGGFIRGGQQWTELAASGGHASFACTICHDPHQSTVTGERLGVRNGCRACHGEMSMAGHGDAVFRRGDYAETLTCESCHMPFATREFGGVSGIGPGGAGRAGDTRTHIFRINTTDSTTDALFTADGSAVALDSAGRARVTVGFVCLRCHDGEAEFRLTAPRAAEIGGRMHGLP